MSRSFATLFALLVLVPSIDARAQTDGLSRARSLLERQSYRRAVRAYEDALSSGSLGPTAVREVYRGLADCHAALRQPDEARDAFVRLLLVEPDHYVPSDASPLVREPFEQAQAVLRERESTAITWTPPDRLTVGEPLRIAVDLPVDVAPSLASRVEVTLLAEDGEPWTSRLVDGRLVVDAERLGDTDQVLLVFNVFDEFGNRVAAIGTLDEPLIVPIVDDAAAESGGGTDAPRGERRIFQRWWFWTIIGAVVVGAAVAIPVGLTAGDSDPCESRLGGPCDLNVRF